MKRIFLMFALFAAVAAVAVAQSATTPKKTKAPATKKVDKVVSKKAPVATAKSDKVVAPVATAAAAAKGPVATFETVEMDYGKIKKGSEPLRVFNFKNTGTEPLIISNAQGSCGCTVPTYPKEPIMPGQSSKIEVRYDTQRVGGFTNRLRLPPTKRWSIVCLLSKAKSKQHLLMRLPMPLRHPTNFTNTTQLKIPNLHDKFRDFFYF